MEKTEKTKNICLSELRVGEAARVEKIDMPPHYRLRLVDLGFGAGAEVVCLGKGPLGDPSAYLARGRILAIRRKDAEKIKCVI